MKFEEWFHGLEVFTLRSERFYDDLDHHKANSEGSYNRMKIWLLAAYNQGLEEGKKKR